MNSLSEIVEKYKDHLLAKCPERSKTFSDREKSKPESARAEAVLFFMLRSQDLDVTINEDPSTGGVDFLCTTSQYAFLVEVTCLEVRTVTKHSGWKEGAASGSYSLITHLLRNKAWRKTPQLSGAPTPRLLAITTEHEGGGELLGIHAAGSLLTSDSKIQVPLGPSEPNMRIVTDLEDSVFFRFSHDGSIEVCRQSISGILLVHIPRNEDACRAVGILHPQPIFTFPVQLLPTVPFVRIRQWPPKEEKIETEWGIARPSAARFRYQTFDLED